MAWAEDDALLAPHGFPARILPGRVELLQRCLPHSWPSLISPERCFPKALVVVVIAFISASFRVESDVLRFLSRSLARQTLELKYRGLGPQITIDYDIK